MLTRNRLLVVRLSFLLFCLLPTLVVGWWALWPVSTSRWEARLSGQLGLHVTIQEIAHPRPTMTVLAGVQVADPETGFVGKADKLQVKWSSRGTVIAASQTSIQLNQLARVHELIHERLLRQWHSKRSRLTASMPVEPSRR